MILKNLHVSGFGTFIQKDFSFSEGINVIYGENGSGKSTLHACLKSMLFGMERGRGKAARHDAYSRYYPWNGASAYGGSLSISLGEEDYFIERVFDIRNKSVTLRRHDSGRVIGSDQECIDRLLGSLTEETYRNTISIGQMNAKTDVSLNTVLKNHLSSVALAGASTLDVTRALASLKEQKKMLRQQIDPEASSRYQALFQEICEIEDHLKAMSGRSDQAESNARKLETALAAENSRRETLDQRLKETQTEAAGKSLSGIKDTRLYRERLQDAWSTWQAAFYERSKPRKRRPRLRDMIPGLLSFLIFFCLGLGTAFYEALPFTDTPFPFPRPPFVIGFFSASAVCLLITFILSVRSGKPVSGSDGVLPETAHFLEHEFLSHLSSSDIIPENKKALDRKIDEYDRLLQKLEQIRAAADASLKKTVALQEQLRTAQAEVSRCQKEAWEYEQTCKRLSELEDQKTALGRTMERNRELGEKIRAVTLAEETISSLSSRIHETFSPVLNSRVSEIIRSVTGSACDAVFIDEDLSVTLRAGGRSIPLESLSRGTIEQIYLALRISAAEILCPDMTPPLLLDDTFAYYDDARLENTLKWLAEHYPGQVLLFTCHRREASVLSRMGAPYHFISLGQQPDRALP